MSVDGNIGGITAVGGLGGGGAAAVSSLANTGQPVLVGLVVGLALVVAGAIVARRAHRNIIAQQ